MGGKADSRARGADQDVRKRATSQISPSPLFLIVFDSRPLRAAKPLRCVERSSYARVALRSFLKVRSGAFASTASQASSPFFDDLIGRELGHLAYLLGLGVELASATIPSLELPEDGVLVAEPAHTLANRGETSQHPRLPCRIWDCASSGRSPTPASPHSEC